MQCVVFTWHMVVSYIDNSIQCVVFTWHMGIVCIQCFVFTWSMIVYNIYN